MAAGTIFFIQFSKGFHIFEVFFLIVSTTKCFYMTTTNTNTSKHQQLAPLVALPAPLQEYVGVPQESPGRLLVTLLLLHLFLRIKKKYLTNNEDQD
jgi:hypothetical protein